MYNLRLFQFPKHLPLGTAYERTLGFKNPCFKHFSVFTGFLQLLESVLN